MKLANLFTEIQETFDMLWTLKVNVSAFRERLQYWQDIAKSRPLKREQYALQEFIEWQYHTYQRRLALVYVFNSELYSTSKYPVIGTVSTGTKVLHDLQNPIPSRGWDAMGKFIMYPTGEVFERTSEENTEVTKEYYSYL